jgi:hypothetical protein
VSSGMLRRVVLIRTDVSEELSASFIRATRIQVVFLRSVRRSLVTAYVVPSSLILVTLMKEALRSSETSVVTRSHGVTSQKTPFYIVTAVKTSNLTRRVTLSQRVLHLYFSWLFKGVERSRLCGMRD